ncbi:S8 family peptidase [Streptomyces sp. OZ13]|uniref:S8 family peptidase n=1 Tax=Streptomyces sp. OZ13 TaxID=3452210 RepID=UPI003F88F4E6
MIPDAHPSSKSPLFLTGLSGLMARTAGRTDLLVGLVDGPVIVDHQEFAGAHIESLREQDVADMDADDAAALHATSTAGVLVAHRASRAPGICPGVTLVTRSVFSSPAARSSGGAAPEDLAEALVDLTDAGVRLVNMSLSLASGRHDGHRAVQQALDHASRRGVIVVAAAGNEGAVDGNVVTRHRAVIPVVAYNRHGQPGWMSTIGPSIGRGGVGAVADGLVSLGAHGDLRPFGGTSAAAAIVTGAIALLWSELPDTAPGELARAVTAFSSRRTSVLPPVMNAWRAFELLLTARR